jgi:hypothetical protein
MYGIKVLFDEEHKYWIWLLDHHSVIRRHEYNVRRFLTYEEAKAYANTILTMTVKVEKID